MLLLIEPGLNNGKVGQHMINTNMTQHKYVLATKLCCVDLAGYATNLLLIASSAPAPPYQQMVFCLTSAQEDILELLECYIVKHINKDGRSVPRQTCSQKG